MELGLDSMMAVELTSGLARDLEIKVPFAALLEGCSIARLAEIVESQLPQESAPAASPLAAAAPDQVPKIAIERALRSDETPLSIPQERLWLLAELASRPEVLNIPAAVRLAGRLNVAALEQALSEVVRRHEALRAVIRTRDDRVFQVFQAAHPWPCMFCI